MAVLRLTSASLAIDTRPHIYTYTTSEAAAIAYNKAVIKLGLQDVRGLNDVPFTDTDLSLSPINLFSSSSAPSSSTARGTSWPGASYTSSPGRLGHPVDDKLVLLAAKVGHCQASS